jgi:flagellar hook-length control protein FliK
MRADAPGLSDASVRLVSDAAPTVHPAPGEPVELALTPAAVLALSTDTERSGDEPGERRPSHDPGASVEAAASALGGRIERTHEATGSTTEAMATAEDVVRQVAPRLTALPRSGRHEIVLRLDPPTLGEVRIEASLRGQELTLHIRAENAGARDLLEQGLPRLRQALERDGVTAGHISVELNLQADARRSSHGTPFARPAAPIATETPRIEPPRRVSLRAVSSAALDLWV